MHHWSHHLPWNCRTVYNLFSCSPRRWKILLNRIGCSFHDISGTRWSARVQNVIPIAAHLPGIKLVLEDLLELNLTAKTRTEVNGALSYVTSFICVIMFVIWYKVPIDFCNKVIQARDAVQCCSKFHYYQNSASLFSCTSIIITHMYMSDMTYHSSRFY